MVLDHVFRPLRARDIWMLGGMLVGLLAFLAFVRWQPIGVTEHSVVRVEHAYRQLLLAPGEVIEEVFKSKHDAYTGAIVYSQQPFLGDRTVEVALLDVNNKVLARSRRPHASYLPGDDTLALQFAWPKVAGQDGKALKLQFRLVKGPPLFVKVSSRSYDAYTSGYLNRNGERVNRDLGLTMLVVTGLTSGQKLGVTAGAVTFVMACLIWLIREKKWQWWAAGIGLVIITPLALGGFWFSFDTLGIADWDYYFSQHENYRQTILRYHQFPFWNPWTCGGTAGLGDPEFPGFTPRFILELLFGIPVGLRLAIWVSVAATGLGMLVLARRLKLSPLAGFLVGIAGAFSSVSLLEIVEGHVNVFAAMWVPWVFWAWLSAYRSERTSFSALFFEKYTIWCAVFLALMFYAGGIYLLMYTGLAFLFLLLLVPNHKRALQVSASAGIVAIGLAAFKMVPVLLWLRQFPDDAYASSTVTLPWLYDILFGRHLHGSYVLFAQDSGWHEYGAYIGLPVAALALIGAVAYRRRRLVAALAVACVAAILLSSTGPALGPFFDVMWFFPRSNISRFILFAIVPLALLAGFGFERLKSYGRGPGVIVVIGIVAIDLMSLTYPISLQSFVLPPVQPPLAPAPSPIAFTNARFDDEGSGSRTTRTYDATLAGYGTTAYCSVLGPQPSVGLVSDEDGGVYVSVSDKQAKAQVLSWSPNKVVVRVETPEETSVAINTNYVQGWQVNGQAVTPSGRVSTRVAPGVHELTFVYGAPGVQVGTIVTVLTIAGIWWGRRVMMKKL